MIFNAFKISIFRNNSHIPKALHKPHHRMDKSNMIKIKKKSTISDTLFPKSEFEFTFSLFTSTAYDIRPIRVEFFPSGVT